MRTRSILFAGLLLFFAGVVFGETEIDQDFMHNLEDTTKSLDSDVAQKDAKAATADAKAIEESFKQVESFFAKKGNAEDAVGFARKSGALAADVEKSIAANDFDAASNSVNALAHSCKSCHNVYKKE